MEMLEDDVRVVKNTGHAVSGADVKNLNIGQDILKNLDVAESKQKHI